MREPNLPVEEHTILNYISGFAINGIYMSFGTSNSLYHKISTKI